MTDQFSVEFDQSPSGGHPHDLLARLYREIGISAVAAALEVSQFPQKPVEEPVSLDDRRVPPVLLGDHLAA
ncbi:hypothetical protein LG047_00920 [Methylocystis sp. WRRC1]|uniref:hypothetical protein n=1 Tax=unclassified Methylocystis TaxID=2625913 RepID=UPI0001F8758F|nr:MULTISPECIES: hypothetical protein [unclassified Methylocystis]MCC3243895.1 hypothetical protein [Methylocystis sp. WRRC1]